MSGTRWMAVALCAVAITCGSQRWLRAEDPEEPAAAAAGPPKTVLDRGDNAWVLTSSALVLMMTAPGLAMFYSGLVRKKNVLGVIMQCIFLMGLMSVIWGLWGYSLSFGGSNPWIGNADHLLLKGVQAEWKDNAPFFPLHPTYNIPMLTHMLFQGMFFIITPALICGAFAERMKFSTMVVFMTLWGTLVYCPICHWVWGSGLLTYNQVGGNEPWVLGGALDFAGGTVVHISSGVSALICALLIGKRLGYGSEPMPPHNLTYTALGAALLWVGWFGFNAGSALAADGIAASAFAATHFSAAAGPWRGPAWNGSSAESPPCWAHAREPWPGSCASRRRRASCCQCRRSIMGVAAGVVCYLACTTLKSKFGYDDSLDAFGVHGVGGTLGAILTGVFATRAVQNLNSGEPIGLIEGGTLLQGQVAATARAWVYSIVVTFVLLKLLDATMGLRVSNERRAARARPDSTRRRRLHFHVSRSGTKGVATKPRYRLGYLPRPFQPRRAT